MIIPVKKFIHEKSVMTEKDRKAISGWVKLGSKNAQKILFSVLIMGLSAQFTFFEES